MISQDGASGKARTPRREKGRQRIEAVLDATAALILEQGLAGVTMHAVARRSNTSIGSMYHFFSDREELLTALKQRHLDALQAILQALLDISDAQWQSATPREVMELLFGQFFRYVQEQPHALILMAAKHDGEGNEFFQSLLRRIIQLRIAGDVQEVDVISGTIYATGIGAMQVITQMDTATALGCLLQVQEMLGTYLEHLERNAA